MSNRSRWMLPLVLALILACRSASEAQTEQPWKAAPFSANAAEIAAAAKLIAKSREPGVVVLLDETRVALDSSNRTTVTHHTIYRLGTQSPGNWGVVGATWQPWRQQKPAIRARVITPDGKEAQLDPKALSESPLTELGLDTFGDGKVLRGPLPALSAGAVIEFETVVRDTSALFSRGLSLTAPAGKEAPVLRSSITIEVPQCAPLKYEVLSLPDAVTTSEVTDGKRTVKVAIGRMAALDPDKVFPLSGENRLPRVSFSTAASWRDTADGYAQISNPVISKSDIAASAKEAIGDATSRDQVIERILQKVQRTIRYSAIQLGEAAIVPTPPGETLKLLYGDCKDQAALMIAMLRVSGIEAHMALLNAGPGPDVNPNLPGFGGFDHAIVYIPGPAPIWLDSTARFSRAGQLPLADQSRLALVIMPDATDLIRTPEFVSRVVETQNVFLAEDGPGRIEHSREFSGNDEINTRTAQSEVATSDLEKALDQASEQLFSADAITNIRRSDPSDFSTPFKMQLEIRGTRNAMTSGYQSAFFILLADLLGQTGFTEVVDADEKRAEGGVSFAERLARQWSYSIEPPPGYKLAELPKKKTIRLGPATLTQDFLALSNNSVTGSILFDSGKRSYTASEFAEMRKGLKELLDDADSILTVSFDLTAQKDLDEGRVAEALQGFRKLIALHPNEAIHHSQLARALISVGLGELARPEARRGVELEPKSGDAYDVLGEVLEYDLIGRRWQLGFELEQARDAYRKAVELAPENDVYRGDLAIALEVSAKGTRYAPEVDLKPAIEQYRMFKAKPDESSSLFRNLPFALFRTGSFRELRTSNTPADIRIAAIAASDGVAAAVRESAKLSGDTRTKALTDASSLLMINRQYPESAGLLKATVSASTASPTSGLIPLLESIHKFEDLPMPPNEPATVAKNLILRITLQDRGPNLMALLTASGQEDMRRHPDQAFGGLRIETELLRGIQAPPRETIADVYLSTTSVSPAGDDKGGYRIEFAAIGPNNYKKNVFVVMENGQYRAVSAGRTDFAVAREAMRLVDKGDLDNARRWMDWIADEQGNYLSDEFDVLVNVEFDEVWNTAIRKDRDRMRYSAAVALSASPDDAARILPILQEGMTKSTGDVQNVLTVAYATALVTLKRFDESAAAGMKALQSDPQSETIVVIGRSLMELNRLDDLLKLLKDNLKNSTEGDYLLNTIAAIHIQQGRFADAELELKKAGSSLPGLNIGAALLWLSQYHPAVTGEDVAGAQRLVDSRRNNAVNLRTLAALKAETGKPIEALNLLKQALNVTGKDLETDDWYILGRIYEQFGEREAAAIAYRKVTPSPRFPLKVTAAYALAQKRLAVVR